MFEPDEDQIRLERNKARELRKSQWWKNRIGRGECYYCHKSFPPKELTLDHLVPVSRGGRTTKGNCVPCCKECNNRKQSLTPVEWEEFIVRLESE
jgi:5-methylcytosine-specific restriction endonuclease McrA